MSQPANETSSSLRDVIVTLPPLTIALLWAVVALTLGASAWLAWSTTNDTLKGVAGQAAVLTIPVAAALVAATGVRRDASRQIDRLTDRFLVDLIGNRLRLWCRRDAAGQISFPFASAHLGAQPEGRSYVHYRLAWRPEHADGLAPADVAFKANVLNFEIIVWLPLDPSVQVPPFANLTRDDFPRIAQDPLLQHFAASIQGAIEEGYAVSLNDDTHAGQHRLRVSLRQKVGTHFLTSPYLKRYFAEDAAIAVNVICNEYLRSGLRPRSPERA